MYSFPATTQEEFARVLAQKLEIILANQKLAPYVLAKALVDGGVRCDRGEYCWVVDVRKTRTRIHLETKRGRLMARFEETDEYLEAWWVTSDYEVLQDPVAHFDLTDEEIHELLNWEWP